MERNGVWLILATISLALGVDPMLLTFPELKCDPGPVAEQLRIAGASPDILAAWMELVAQEIRPEDDE